MGKLIYGLIFVLLLAFTGVTLYFRFTTGSFQAGGVEMDKLFGVAKERILEESDKIRQKIEEARAKDATAPQ